MASELLAVGECMVELARGADARYALAYGGDTFNTAVYAARMGARVGYATAVGDDAYSDGIVALAEAEGLDATCVRRREGRRPGLYLIETTPAGERSFTYWRDRSPARELFEEENDATAVTSAMCAARSIFFSGITLSIYPPPGLDRFERSLRQARAAGAHIAFDGNYRPSGWRGVAQAREVFTRFLTLCDTALPTLEDEHAMWGEEDAAAVVARLARSGPREIALKCGPRGVYVSCDGGPPENVPADAVSAAVDTTAAGDSFNGAYLAARLRGDDPKIAAADGCRLAAVKIMHRGAIAPREATLAARRSGAP